MLAKSLDGGRKGLRVSEGWKRHSLVNSHNLVINEREGEV